MKTWWHEAAIYQIYPRSFSDSNSDGIGDIQGIIERVPYLSSLGIDAVWMSPFYPSELADGGYDVIDYRDIDPRIGTIEEFTLLVKKLHEVNIKVIIDIVPNHSSNKHQWFQEAGTGGDIFALYNLDWMKPLEDWAEDPHLTDMRGISRHIVRLVRVGVGDDEIFDAKEWSVHFKPPVAERSDR